MIVREVMDLLCLDLVEKELVTQSITIHVNTLQTAPAHSTASLPRAASADSVLAPAAAQLYECIADPRKPVRRVNISCNHVVPENQQEWQQLSLFDENAADEARLARNKQVQKAVLQVKKRFGKDAILKGTNLREGATTRERNHQIGGHRGAGRDGKARGALPRAFRFDVSHSVICERSYIIQRFKFRLYSISLSYRGQGRPAATKGIKHAVLQMKRPKSLNKQ